MVDNQAEILQLRFEGNGISPERVKPLEIAELIKDFQEILLSTIKQDFPEINTDEVLFTLEGIHNESLGINFDAWREGVLLQVRKAVVSSYLLITTSIQTGLYSNLSPNAFQSLKRISSFWKKYDCNAQLNRNGETISVITPSTEIRQEKVPLIKCNTNIYGEIVDFGSNIFKIK